MEVALAIASVMAMLLHMIVPSPSSYCCCSTCAPSSSSSYYYVVVVTQDIAMVEPHTHKQFFFDPPKMMDAIVATIGIMEVLLHATSSPSPSSACYYCYTHTPSSSSSCYYVVGVTRNVKMAKPHINKQQKMRPPTVEVIVVATSLMIVQ
jgi:hypothetical protein